jgi:GT2 family glycosyltransferase
VKRILAIIVLYKMSAQESPTYQALSRAMRQLPALDEALEIFLADNSPAPSELPQSFTGTFLHDGTNEGLAQRYNQALAIAEEKKVQWLLLFDQDTKPTAPYFLELLALSARLEDSQVAVIVPKLVQDGRILSPHPPVFRKARYKITLESEGLVGDDLRAFNSGALVRVEALREIGGFPENYWLDYLDHATFHRIQDRGGKLFVMTSVLEHELSDATPDRPVNPGRLLNRLRAEERYYAEHGTPSERLRHRFDLLRQIVGWGRRGHFDQAALRWKAFFRSR